MLKIMERLEEAPSDPDPGCRHGVNIMNDVMLENAWTGSSTPNNNPNNILYIAVEYIKDDHHKLDTGGDHPPVPSPPRDDDTFADFDRHVSPLDPNMGSAAGYSPVYGGGGGGGGASALLIAQLVRADEDEDGDDVRGGGGGGGGGASDSLAVAGRKRDVTGQRTERDGYVQMIIPESTDSLPIIPEAGDQEVTQLLIMDQNTGISYSVNAQEYLEDRSLAEDQQLLANLAPVSLLDSDLLALDENALKVQLSKIIVEPTGVHNMADGEQSTFRPKRTVKSEIIGHCEDDLMSYVHAITDKPILSRAKATLPVSHLTIKDLENGCGVFARKYIPNRTQFGPLEGILNDEKFKLENDFELSVESERGTFQYLNISNEDYSNWMVFVRKATNYEEQNCVLVQFENNLYYTTIRNILPKQELLVGYGIMYATSRNLSVLEPHIKAESYWPCFECDETFLSSSCLQRHLDTHDTLTDIHCARDKLPTMKRRRKSFANVSKGTTMVQCCICNKQFAELSLSVLKNHLIEEHNVTCKEKLSEYYTFLNDREIVPKEKINFSDIVRIEDKNLIQQQKKYRCPSCTKSFLNTDRLQRHLMVHGSDASKPIQCSHCPKRFLTLAALRCHTKTHEAGGRRAHECPICGERFPHVLQLRGHVPAHAVHGRDGAPGYYTCPHCAKHFRAYAVIRKHIRAFHCERRHHCTMCTKRFPSLDKLRMHQLRHSDHKEFLCANCGKQFKRRDKLVEHARRMHGQQQQCEGNGPSAKQQRGGALKRRMMTVKGLHDKQVVAVRAGDVDEAEQRFTPKVSPMDYHRFIYKCHKCLVGFKRRGMLVNHLAKRHPDIPPASVPELNLPILRATRDYFCTHCDKVYRSSSKRKAHMLQKHPGAALPPSSRRQQPQQQQQARPATAAAQGGPAVIMCTVADGAAAGAPDATYSQTVGSVTTHPQLCQWCHKQYASKAKLLQHQRREHCGQLQEKHPDIKHHRNTTNQPAKVTSVTSAAASATYRHYNNQLAPVSVTGHTLVRPAKLHSNATMSGRDCDGPFVALSDSNGQYQESAAPSMIVEQNGGESRVFQMLDTENNLVPPR